MKAHPDHHGNRRDLNYLLEYFPQVDKLIIDWRVLLSETDEDDRLFVPYDIYAHPRTRELEINIGNKSAGIVDSGGDPEELLPAIAAETRDLLAHLHLPFLESLSIRIDVNDPIPVDPTFWYALADGIKLEKWGKTLKRVDLVISFDLGNEPDAEVRDVSRSFLRYNSDVGQSPCR
jgi:hypothetical protein